MMRHVSKFMVSVAAVTAVSAMAVAPAFADYELSNVGSASSEDYITVSFNAVSDLSGGSQTLLVLDTELTDEWDESNIKYIDQDDEDDITSFVLPSDAEGTYYIYVGGNGSVWSGSVDIGEETGDEIEVVIGDVDGDEDANLLDASWIISYATFALTDEEAEDEELFPIGEYAGTFDLDGDEAYYVFGDVDGDEDANLLDASWIISYATFALTDEEAEDEELFPIGEYITVTVEAE